MTGETNNIALLNFSAVDASPSEACYVAGVKVPGILATFSVDRFYRQSYVRVLSKYTCDSSLELSRLIPVVFGIRMMGGRCSDEDERRDYRYSESHISPAISLIVSSEA